MSESGSTLILRNHNSQLWLYPPDGAGRPHVIDVEQAQQVIARSDLERIGRRFESGDALDAFRQTRAARGLTDKAVDTDVFDLEDVDGILEVAQQWRAEGEGDKARRLARQLLNVPVVRTDPAAKERVEAFLE
jgi:hypothetical protein